MIYLQIFLVFYLVAWLIKGALPGRPVAPEAEVRSKQVVEMLQKCLDDIADESRLVAGACAIDRNGHSIDPRSPLAVGWSMDGLLNKHDPNPPASYPTMKKRNSKLTYETPFYGPIAKAAKDFLLDGVITHSGGRITISTANDFWINTDQRWKIHESFEHAIKRAS